MGGTKNIAFWIVLFLLLVALFNVFNNGMNSESSREVSFSEFMKQIDSGRVSSVKLDGETIYVRNSDGTSYKVIQPLGTDLIGVLRKSDIDVQAIKQEKSGLMTTLSLWLPFIILIGVWVFLMNRMQGGGRGGAMGFGKSKAKLLTEKQGRVTLSLIHI